LKDSHDAKIYLESVGFPCYYGETLSYVQIANIFKNIGFIKEKNNKQIQTVACLCRDPEGCVYLTGTDTIECGYHKSGTAD
jgi:hypothetical protein